MLPDKLMFYYHPTTTVVIDDDRLFLDTIKIHLASDAPYELYEDAKKAIQAIQAINSNKLNLCEILTNLDIYEIQYNKCLVQPIDIQISHIHKEILDANRNNQVSLIFVDYNMPEINGLDFCRIIKNHPAKKVLLTGQADKQTAIAAFNEGIIDKFILKSESNLSLVLNNIIKTAHNEYFYKLSESISNLLICNKNLPFNDTQYTKFILDYLSNNKFIEYYVYDKHGSYLCIQSDNTIQLLIIRSEKEIYELYELARDNGVPSKLSRSLLHREKILFFPSQKDMKQPVSNWEKYMLPAKKIASNSKYYYSIINNYLIK